MKVFVSTREDFEVLHSHIKNFQQTNSTKVLDFLWEQISVYVRFFPRLVFRQNNEDIQADFYLYVMERRYTLFEKFDPSLASFKSYLALRLRSYYLNFIKREKHLHPNQVSYTEDEYLFLETDKEGTNLQKDEDDKKTTNLFPDYKDEPLKYLCVKLYYLDFFTEDDFLKLKEFTGKTYALILEEFDELHNVIADKKMEQLKIDERLSKVYQNILNLSEKSNQLTNSTVSNSISQEEQLMVLKQLDQKRTKLLNEYHRLNVFSPIKNIAQLLNKKETKIANVLGYQRKLMEKRIGRLLLNQEEENGC